MAEETSEPDYRFTLANERTFLAYQRTGIALVAAGLAALNFLDLAAPEVVLALLLMLAGTIASVGGYLRFRGVDRAIRDGLPLPANPTVHLFAAVVIGCVVVAVAAALTVW